MERRKAAIEDSHIPVEQAEAITGRKFNLPPGTRIDKSLIPLLSTQAKADTTETPVTETQARDLAAAGKSLPKNPKIIPDEKPTPVSEDEKQAVKRKFKLKDALPKAKTALTQVNQDIDTQIDLVDNILKHPGLGKITGLRGSIPNVPGGNASNAQALIDQMKSQAFLGSFQRLKQASPNGSSGMGALSDSEGVKLEKAAVATDQKQGTPAFATAIGKYREALIRSKENLNQGFQDEFGDIISMPSVGGNAHATATPARINARVKIGGQQPSPTVVRQKLPGGVRLSAGQHTDAQGNRIMVYPDGTYEEQ